ncbi:hypothetical protein ACOQFO_14440 [Ureibacillus sp. MALMAid1270]|uniref:hypothetical protein n=1 Tax=Ureibacillus sp. MALMAid1270 TaxID=3411629 RepID=UPI003BA40F5C
MIRYSGEASIIVGMKDKNGYEELINVLHRGCEGPKVAMKSDEVSFIEVMKDKTVQEN